MYRVFFALVSSALLAACAGGKAVRVDCDGPLTLINPPIAKAEGKAAQDRRRMGSKAEDRKP